MRDNILNQPYRFIYNKFQAMYLLNNGAEIKDVDIHPRTGNICFKFVNNEKFQELFNNWKTYKL